ncbi:RimJ/RimL family protein N-acetyltransferase [Neolewinella xylanilytica]|uniref:RimJ/RimL family protein N-acetyltransferase n=1 Tax=Neolewinella xylanilytica TaxID=1514080 RepID=A0A2S6I4G1_9BACT|nr:GNAT family N-acetyltransferase [Neolewinella xylanilytica]PPK86066.1 RimJ/RimL family protein N-acetyltransferase [Neolewinella xylanilytica]
MQAPELRTDRLLLSKPELADAGRIVELANDPVIAEFTLSVPHPYTEAAAITWLAAINEGWAEDHAFSFAIRNPENGEMLGAVGLHISPKFGYAELGYWMGAPYRGRGYAREAVGAVIDFGFRHTDLVRIQANHRDDNPASGRVLLANGLKLEGTLDDFIIKDGNAWTVVQYRILRREWQRSGSGT